MAPHSHEELHRASSTDVAGALELLREHGERVTAPRLAMLEVLASQTEYLSAEAIAELVQAHNPAVHRATVYRSIERFVELGMLSRLPGASGASIYHLALVDHSHQHLHGQCRRCQAVVHLPVSAFDAAVRSLTPEFHWEPEHSSLIGLCADCARD